MDNLWLFDKRRLEILEKLNKCDSVCGCDIREEVGIKKTLLHYHLGLLKERGYIEETRCGREKQYRIVPAKRSFIRKILQLIKAS